MVIEILLWSFVFQINGIFTVSTWPLNNSIRTTTTLKLLKMNFLANGCIASYGPYNIDCLNSIWLDIGCTEGGGLYPERLSVDQRKSFDSKTI